MARSQKRICLVGPFARSGEVRLRCFAGRAPSFLIFTRRESTQEVTVVQAYILIQTEVGKAAQVAKEVAAIKGVTEAEDVTGPYDVIVRAEARNVDDLGKLVVAKIQAVEGITRTLTCPVVHL
jgi:DNA-binding Lrp family transcriptional regulator